MKKILSCFLIYFLFLIFPVKASALLGFDFDINSSLSTSYDDNVTFVKDDKKSDNVTNVIIGLGGRREGKTYRLDIGGDIIRHVFAHNSSFSNNSQDFHIDLQKEISKYDRISVTNRFVHAEEPRSFDEDFGRTSGRYSYYRNTFNSVYVRDFSQHVSMEGHYGNENYRISEANGRDSFLHSLGLDVNYIKSSATAFLFGYDFTTRHVDGSGRANVHTLDTGLRHWLTRQLYMDGRAGISFVEAFDGGRASEPSVVVGLTNDFNETDSIRLSYSQTSTPSSFSADIFDAWRITADLKRQLLERLKMSATVFFGEGTFDALSIQDRQTGVSTRFSYDVRKDVIAFLAYTYSEVDSNLETRGYNRNLVEMGVRIIF